MQGTSTKLGVRRSRVSAAALSPSTVTLAWDLPSAWWGLCLPCLLPSMDIRKTPPCVQHTNLVWSYGPRPDLSPRHQSITNESLLFRHHKVLVKGESAFKNPKRESVCGGLNLIKERAKKIKLPSNASQFSPVRGDAFQLSARLPESLVD